jgi:membrane fusion protein (multidrug efflux system)
MGKVMRIGNAATSQFALLPKLNEAGTFTKITQRIRVRIDVEQEQEALKPGMMVEVFIDPKE